MLLLELDSLMPERKKTVVLRTMTYSIMNVMGIIMPTVVALGG